MTAPPEDRGKRAARDPPSESQPRKGDQTWPSRVGMLTRAGRLHPIYWLIPLAISVVIGLAGLFGYRVIKRELQGEIQSRLETQLRANEEALRTWIEAETALAGALASRPALVDAAGVLLGLARTGTLDEVKASERNAVLSGAVEPGGSRVGFSGFALLDPSGRVIAADEPARVGSRLPPAQMMVLAGILDGTPRLLAPFLDAGSAAQAADGTGGDGAVMLVAAPIGSAARPAPGALALRVPIERGFSRILGVARQGETGETYAVDRDGRLLSQSRFDGELRAIGLLPAGTASTLRIEIRNPGGNLLDGYVPSLPVKARPFTRAAAGAVGGGSGVDVDGYPDYRGVPVVGAWRWLGDLDFGIVTEVDATEAFRPLRYVTIAFWTLFGAAALAGILLALGSVVINLLNRRVRDVKQLGQYTLIQKIGEGAMGRVYRASHAMLRRPTAVKLLQPRDPGSIERFEREVQLTSELSHPNTIAIYDYGRTPEGVFYYAMEYLDGVDLADLIKIEGPIPPSRVVHILRQLCGSLAEAHAKGFVHRDIKPSNIVLSQRGGEPDIVKVLDFGLVRRVERDRAPLTSMGVVFGTPGFIPPETLKDPGVFDARGDIYAVGVVGYELLTGVSLFERTTVYETCRRHVEVDPVPPSQRVGRPLPPILSAVIMSCLAKDPAERPQTVTDLREMLDGCEDVGPWTRGEALAWWAVHAQEVAALRPELREDAKAAAGTVPVDLGSRATRRTEAGSGS